MSWRVSPILVPAIAEVKAKHPGMTVFTIGDAEHQAETSDHNPDTWGFVCAGDAMIGPHFTAADAEDLFDRLTAMIRAGDKRPAYAIYNRRIVSSTVHPGVVRAYTLSNPHTDHVHLSVPHGSNPHPTTAWGLYTEGDDMDQATFNNLMAGFLASTGGKQAMADVVWNGPAWNGPEGRETAAVRLGHVDEAVDDILNRLPEQPLDE